MNLNNQGKIFFIINNKYYFDKINIIRLKEFF